MLHVALDLEEALLQPGEEAPAAALPAADPSSGVYVHSGERRFRRSASGLSRGRRVTFADEAAVAVAITGDAGDAADAEDIENAANAEDSDCTAEEEEEEEEEEEVLAFARRPLRAGSGLPLPLVRGGAARHASCGLGVGDKGRTGPCASSALGLLVLFVVSLAGMRLLELGFFRLPADHLPWVANGTTARDRKTGALFQLRSTPPGLNDTFQLFGIAGMEQQGGSPAAPTPSPAPAETAAAGEICVVGLYTHNSTEASIAEWKAMIGQRQYPSLFRALLARPEERRLSLRVVVLRNSLGVSLARAMADEARTELARLHPWAPARAAEDERLFIEWFPERLRAGDVVWLHWASSSTRMYLNGALRGPAVEQQLGRAILRAQLDNRGAGLLAILYKLL